MTTTKYLTIINPVKLKEYSDICKLQIRTPYGRCLDGSAHVARSYPVSYNSSLKGYWFAVYCRKCGIKTRCVGQSGANGEEFFRSPQNSRYDDFINSIGVR